MGAKIDLTGKQFGRLTVIQETEVRRRHDVKWKCVCQCGNDAFVFGEYLRAGSTVSCGCFSVDNRRSRLIDLCGKEFGRLSVIECVSVNGKPEWKCVCRCGNVIEVLGAKLRSGELQSCGCLRVDVTRSRATTHGMSKSRTYRIWSGMHTRCFNSNYHLFKDYGGRGITICERWMSFENFLADMGEVPAGRCIERIDNNGNYCPENCRWATKREQNRNKRTSVIITIDGQSKSAVEWSEVTGVPGHLIRKRIKRGWNPKQAVFGESSQLKFTE